MSPSRYVQKFFDEVDTVSFPERSMACTRHQYLVPTSGGVVITGTFALHRGAKIVDLID